MPNYFPDFSQLSGQDSFVLFHERQILVRDDRFIWNHTEVAHLLSTSRELMLVELDGSRSIVAASVPDVVPEKLGAELRSLRSLLGLQDERAFNLVGKANQILDWYASHRYCGVCGAPTEQHANQRALQCSGCSHQFFPRINPCAIMLVVRDDEILLARSARFATGFYSCLAGFIEIGETPEETVVREVREEVGIEVQNVRYAKSQSWPFPSQLMLGFYADYKSGIIVPEEAEIEAADWFKVTDLPPVPSARISVAGQLIQDHVQRVTSGHFEK